MPATASRGGDPILSLRDARRRFGARAALDGVDLDLGEGEIFALLGLNGAGKSTLAKVAVGALALSGGAVQVLGADPRRSRVVRRAIGVAPQEIALYPKLTIRENLAVFAAIAGAPRRRRSADVAAALSVAVCDERADDRVERLSGGWRRRANLAAALVHRPRLLVLDEPSEGLDAQTREVMAGVLRELRADGAAVLLITHHAQEVSALADRVGVLHRGRMLAEGPPGALLQTAFGAREELVVRLSAPAAARAAALLTACGLVADADAPVWCGMVWRGMVEAAATRARSLHDALQASGVGYRELAVRPPGLDQLLARLTRDASA